MSVPAANSLIFGHNRGVILGTGLNTILRVRKDCLIGTKKNPSGLPIRFRHKQQKALVLVIIVVPLVILLGTIRYQGSLISRPSYVIIVARQVTSARIVMLLGIENMAKIN